MHHLLSAYIINARSGTSGDFDKATECCEDIPLPSPTHTHTEVFRLLVKLHRICKVHLLLITQAGFGEQYLISGCLTLLLLLVQFDQQLENFCI